MKSLQKINVNGIWKDIEAVLNNLQVVAIPMWEFSMFNSEFTEPMEIPRSHSNSILGGKFECN